MVGKRLTAVFSLAIAALMLSSLSLGGLVSAQAPQPLYFGVIGADDSQTAFGVSLAVQRLSVLGALITPDGNSYTLKVVTAEASSAADVANAITELKKNNIDAIFGPDDDKLLMDSLPALQSAGVPIFTSATTTALKATGMIFRSRANDSWQMNALAQVVSGDLKSKKIAIYQGDADASQTVSELVNALTKLNVPPAPPVIQQPGGKTADSANALTANQPDAIIAIGTTAEEGDVYRTLRSSGYSGLFATTRADETAFIQALPLALRGGIYGVTTWAYSWQVPTSQDFTRDSVDLFGTTPQSLSAAAYDSAVAAYVAMKNGGIEPDTLTASLLKLPKTASLQGTFDATLGNNELSSTVAVIMTNPFGAPTVIARFDNTGRLRTISTTATFTPRPPTATPNGVVATTRGILNVRNGPGPNYLVVGQLKAGVQNQVIGASSDYRWLVITYRAVNGWILAADVDVFGNVSTLPIVPNPPTPIPSATRTATRTPTATASPTPH
ncbi:MAG TPA: ABC transporter substrate-binding protein [Aggregatilineales bacterium]|nr:ABC transporter substrate-binding protein [Aggregatilineales bacterium]